MPSEHFRFERFTFEMKETFFGSVNSMREALLLIEAARLDILPRTKRRLSESDRLSIKSGSIFVWDEGETGIIRWTDGLKWSSSKDIGDFVAYVQKPDIPGTDSPPVAERLHKKVISVLTADGKKFHMAAYYTPRDTAQGKLSVPPQNLVVIPPNYYTRIRQNKTLNQLTQTYMEIDDFDSVQQNRVVVRKSIDSSREGSMISNPERNSETLPTPTSVTDCFYGHEMPAKMSSKPSLPPISTLFQIADGVRRPSGYDPGSRPPSQAFIRR